MSYRSMKALDYTVTAVLTLITVIIFLGETTCPNAHAAEVRLPPVVIGEWCYLGQQGLLNVARVNAQLYANCKDNVGGGGCEDISFFPDGMGNSANPCGPKCRVTHTSNTIYGLDAEFDCDGHKDRKLLNMVAPNRLLITGLDIIPQAQGKEMHHTCDGYFMAAQDPKNGYLTSTRWFKVGDCYFDIKTQLGEKIQNSCKVGTLCTVDTISYLAESREKGPYRILKLFSARED